MHICIVWGLEEGKKCSSERGGMCGGAQVTSDIPAHASLRGQDAGGTRTFDDGCRGVGGNWGIPTASVGATTRLLHLPVCLARLACDAPA